MRDDPLTMAELASKQVGHENLQETLRILSNQATKFSVNHALLAALSCPIYITTNYDVLFEKAFKEIHRGGKIPVVVNDADMQTNEVQDALANKDPVLFKIHGCAERTKEHLILTRRDYRIHYRFNVKFFTKIKSLMEDHCVLFAGFSHKDPEVSRLVEDIIYDYENHQSGKPAPRFFSLQFQMLSHTPEIFAARGIVALQPSPAKVISDDSRSLSLANSLGELIARQSHVAAPITDLYDDLKLATDEISAALQDALKRLESEQASALDILVGRKPPGVLGGLQGRLGHLASQGVYLADEQGMVKEHATPPGIPGHLRTISTSLEQRSYFRQARSFRASFVSDVDRSMFNGRGTFFLCVPLLRDEQMKGLLFSACQIGQWSRPIDIAKKLWAKSISFVLVDSNGICLLPPNNEFAIEDLQEVSGGFSTQADANVGYPFNKLMALSQRDRLVGHIGRTVVPVELDDDVLHFSGNFKQFSVIAEVPKTRWKVALSMAITK